MPKKLFIIIVTWNGQKFIQDCLNSVYQQTESGFGVIVVDNKSEDRTREIIKENFKDVILIENDNNQGFAKGNNIGINKALSLGADYVVLLNQDTEVSDNFVKSGVQYLEDNVNVGLASPIIQYPDSDKVWFAGSKLFRGKDILSHPTTKVGEHINKKSALEKIDKNITADWLPACALFIKKDVFQKIGLIDESFFMYGEDLDFSLRALRAGYQLGVVSNMTIVHKEQLNSKISINLGLFKKILYKARARCKIVQRYYSISEKCYYIIKLIYTPFFQLAYAVRKIIS
ncbi:MAG: glycosyltransferase family 2 protein [Patescibacteria group bacterium]